MPGTCHGPARGPSFLAGRWRRLRKNRDRGEVPAQLVWMGVMVALAIAAGAVITALVMAKVNGITLQ